MTTVQDPSADFDRLAALAKTGSAEIRPALLCLMTDFYVGKPVHTPEQIRRYTELALLLIDRVDADTRASVAASLADYAAPPPEVMQRLLRDEIDTTLAPPVAPPFAGGSARADELSELFFAADTAERRLILINLPLAPFPPAEPVTDAVAGEAVKAMERAALDHNRDAFVTALEQALGISRSHALRMVDDQTGEPILAAARALGMTAATLQRILLCLNPGISRSVQRVYELSWLYEEMELDAALRLVAVWRASGRPQDNAAKAMPQTSRAIPDDALSGHNARRPLLPPRPKVAWEEHAKQRVAGSA